MPWSSVSGSTLLVYYGKYVPPRDSEKDMARMVDLFVNVPGAASTLDSMRLRFTWGMICLLNQFAFAFG